jgi:hypothetical protein
LGNFPNPRKGSLTRRKDAKWNRVGNFPTWRNQARIMAGRARSSSIAEISVQDIPREALLVVERGPRAGG